MLKLMKYEFIHSYRTFLLSFLIFLAGCILFPFMMDGFATSLPVVTAIFGIVFSVLLIGIFIALIISIFINYDRSMFKRPAYLTLTLPVSTTELILSKVLTTIIWLIVAVFVLFFGFAMMALVLMIKENTFSFSMISEWIGLFGKGFGELLIHYPLTMFGYLLFMLGDIFMVIGTIYFALTVVHTKWFRKHQFVFGIVIYIGLNLIIGWLTNLIFGVSTNFGLTINSGESLSLFSYGIYYILIGAIFTFLTIYIIDHHLEIE